MRELSRDELDMLNISEYPVYTSLLTGVELTPFELHSLHGGFEPTETDSIRRTKMEFAKILVAFAERLQAAGSNAPSTVVIAIIPGAGAAA